MTTFQVAAVALQLPGGTPNRHISAPMVFDLVAGCWVRLIDSTAGVMTDERTALVTATLNFHSELLEGAVAIDIRVSKVGTTSMTLTYTVEKDGQVCSSGTVVLAKVDPTRTRSVPFDGAERAALERLRDC